MIVHVDLASTPPPLDVPRRYGWVLLVVHDADAIVGHVWMTAAARVTSQAQWRAIADELGDVILRRKLRHGVERALERPSTPAEPLLSVVVVVCTRDRPDQLSDCVASLRVLRRPGVDVLVVDNAPSDDRTRDLCEREGVRYVREPHPGQTRARNRGILESGADVVAFTDDDCIVDSRWLDTVDDAFADPLVMVATGYIGPHELERKAQLLFELHGGFERHATHRVFDPRTVPPLDAASVAGAGANMLFRREAFRHTGLFAEDLGPGTPARSSDDKYAFYKVLRAGFRIDYDPRRIVWHRHRTEWDALLRIMNDYGVAEFGYSTRCLVVDRDPRATRIWRWWLRHFAGDARRAVTGHRNRVPLALTAAEIRGAFAGPGAWRRSVASRRGIPPLTIADQPVPERDQTPAAPAPVAVARELPSMSVAIASYNRRDRLDETLRTLLQQNLTSDRFEVIVVLDGSTDGSSEMARSFQAPFEMRVLEHPNSGLATTRNRGAAAARHPVVVFLDDDIEPEPRWLVEHASAHAAGRDERVVFGSYPPALRTEGLWEQELRGWWEDHFRRKGAPGHRWGFVDVLDGNMSLPRTLFERLGGFDEEFRAGRRQDWEFGIRLIAAGTPFEYRKDARGWHHFDPRLASVVRNAQDEGRYDVTLVRKHPQARSGLPLGRFALTPAMPRGSGVRQRALRHGGAGAGLALAGSLERAGMRVLWRRLVNAMLVSSYLEGVRRGLDEGEDLVEFLRPDDHAALAPESRVPLDDQPLPGTAPGDELVLAYAGRPFVGLPAAWPGQQWDWEMLTHRAAADGRYAYAVLLALQAAGEPDAGTG